MGISQKTYYALRALFELARRGPGSPLKTSQIAEAQAIPVRFLEVILNQLKQGGFVESRRGAEGGHLLAVPASRLSVGEVIRFMEGPLCPVACGHAGRRAGCGLSRETCGFSHLWTQVEQALSEVYDQATFESLLERQRQARAPLNFAI